MKPALIRVKRKGHNLRCDVQSQSESYRLVSKKGSLKLYLCRVVFVFSSALSFARLSFQLGCYSKHIAISSDTSMSNCNLQRVGMDGFYSSL